MTEIEYQEFVRHCPYDAMGDYSMFRKEQTAVSYTHLDVYKRQGMCYC